MARITACTWDRRAQHCPHRRKDFGTLNAGHPFDIDCPKDRRYLASEEALIWARDYPETFLEYRNEALNPQTQDVMDHLIAMATLQEAADGQRSYSTRD